MVCDYPQIITEVTPPRGQKGVWDNSQLGFHSSRPGIGYIRPGIGYRGGVWYCGILVLPGIGYMGPGKGYMGPGIGYIRPGIGHIRPGIGYTGRRVVLWYRIQGQRQSGV